MKYIISELVPVDFHKSFYGKAIQIQKGRTYYLKSYNTIVCAVTPSGKVKRYWNGWSATTARHVDSFLVAHGLPKMNKATWQALPLSNVTRDYYSTKSDFNKRSKTSANLTWQDSLRIMYARRENNNY